jgi:hypothetical protein
MTADPVQRARTLRASGLSYAAVAARLNAEGVPTTSGVGSWHSATVRRLVDHQAHETWNAYMRRYRGARRA